MINKLKKVYKRIQVYLANTAWIMAEKIAVMGLTFGVTVVLARYLGPEQFGILAYANSLVAIFGIAGHVGLSGLVVQELVKAPESKNTTMGTSFVLKGLGYMVGFSLILITAFLTESLGGFEFWVLFIVAFGMIFKPLDVIDFWFQSIVKAKYASISKTVAAIIGSTFKILLVSLGAQLVWFAIAHLVQAIIASILLITFFILKSNLKVTEWKFSKEKAKELFSQGWVVFLGSIFAVIYLKVDQVMLRWLDGAEEVGIYTVAATMSEAWYFVPMAVVASFFPKLIKLKQESPQQYHHRLQQLFDFLLTIALVIAVLVTLLANPIITIFFSDVYKDAVPILVVHVWAALFIFLRAAFSKWILIENVLMFSLITQGLGAITNVALNFWLIPRYGGLGAAYATLISYAMASYIALLFNPKTQVVFVMMTKSFFAPIRYSLLRKRT